MNAADVDLLRGMIVVRVGAPFRPKYRIPGSDVAGVVEAVGSGVTRFRPGDEVFGDLSESGFGAFAEYVRAPQDALAPKPAKLTFEEAATIPQAAIIALQGLRDIRPVKAGQQVLVNGAGGGMGTFAVQMAKSFGAASPAWTARPNRTSSDRSALTTSSTMPRRTSRRPRTATTWYSTSSGRTRSPAPSSRMGPWAW